MDTLRLDDALLVNSQLASAPSRIHKWFIRWTGEKTIKSLESLEKVAGVGSRYSKEIATKTELHISNCKPGDELIDPDLIASNGLLRTEQRIRKLRREVQELESSVKKRQLLADHQQRLLTTCEKLDDHYVDWINALQSVRWNVRIADELKTTSKGRSFNKPESFMHGLLNDG